MSRTAAYFSIKLASKSAKPLHSSLVDFLKKTSKEKIETEVSKATDGMNREQLRTTGKAIKNELKRLIADSDKQYDDIHDIIVAFRQLMPYTRMLISRDGYLIHHFSPLITTVHSSKPSQLTR